MVEKIIITIFTNGFFTENFCKRCLVMVTTMLIYALTRLKLEGKYRLLNIEKYIYFNNNMNAILS